MANLIDSATAILLSAEKNLKATASNVANASTPGFKRHVGFSEILQQEQNRPLSPPQLFVANDFTQGKLSLTEKSLDLAVVGPGFVALRDGENQVFGRGGSFHLVEGGMLADAAGHILQQAGGGDLVTSGGELEFLEDGTVLENGLPIGAIGLVELSDAAGARALGGSLFTIQESALAEASQSQLRQGFLEQSNVEMSEEMVSMMAAVRRAEGAGRIMQFYDQMIGQAIQTFSGSGR